MTERMGPGWIDDRSKWKPFVDPFDIRSARHGRPEHVKFWERPHEWVVCEDGSFALETATNRGKKNRLAIIQKAKKSGDKEKNSSENSPDAV